MSWLADKKVPGGVATAIVLICGLAVVGGVISFVVLTATAGTPALIEQILRSVDDLRTWPIHLPQSQLDQLAATLNRNRGSIASGALSTAATLARCSPSSCLRCFA
ncbi:hypothetical protein [Amycolatopsis minnesotensis]|uniref:Uncharacterized protein n=1 Tax=Amycolatopsis minnesotensis TaxID=337894 RepID=A0ABP5EBV9_9PSEU